MASKPGRYGIDPETGYPLCQRGHVISPENRYRRSCKKCEKNRQKASQKAYRQTEKYKANKKAYNQNEEYKSRQKTYQKVKRIDNLADGYIAKRLNIPVGLAPTELTEIKRLSIQLHRSLKNANQIKSNHINNGECTGSTGRRAATCE